MILTQADPQPTEPCLLDCQNHRFSRTMCLHTLFSTGSERGFLVPLEFRTLQVHSRMLNAFQCPQVHSRMLNAFECSMHSNAPMLRSPMHQVFRTLQKRRGKVMPRQAGVSTGVPTLLACPVVNQATSTQPVTWVVVRWDPLYPQHSKLGQKQMDSRSQNGNVSTRAGSLGQR